MEYDESPKLYGSYVFSENQREWDKIPSLHYMKEDIALAFKRDTYVVPETIAESVFGRQKEEKSVSLQHLTHLLKERSKLHVRHVNDIKHRWNECQDLLALARINPAGPDKRLSNLEMRLLQLESDERKAELDFWRDSAEIRQNIFDAKKDYSAVSSRETIFDNVEGSYD